MIQRYIVVRGGRENRTLQKCTKNARSRAVTTIASKLDLKNSVLFNTLYFAKSFQSSCSSWHCDRRVDSVTFKFLRHVSFWVMDLYYALIISVRQYTFIHKLRYLHIVCVYFSIATLSRILSSNLSNLIILIREFNHKCEILIWK